MEFSRSITSTIAEVRSLLESDSITFTRADRILDCLVEVTAIESLWIACNSIDAAKLEVLLSLPADLKLSSATGLESEGQELLKSCVGKNHKAALMQLANLHKFDAFAATCLIAAELGQIHVDAIRNLIADMNDYQMSLSA